MQSIFVIEAFKTVCAIKLISYNRYCLREKWRNLSRYFIWWMCNPLYSETLLMKWWISTGKSSTYVYSKDEQIWVENRKEFRKQGVVRIKLAIRRGEIWRWPPLLSHWWHFSGICVRTTGKSSRKRGHWYKAMARRIFTTVLLWRSTI